MCINNHTFSDWSIYTSTCVNDHTFSDSANHTSTCINDHTFSDSANHTTSSMCVTNIHVLSCNHVPAP